MTSLEYEAFYKGQILHEIGDPGKDASFELNLPLAIDGGTWTMNFVSRETVPLPFLATPENVRDALAALQSIGSINNVEVTGTPGGPYRIFMRGALGGQPLPQELYPFTANGLNLTPSVAQLNVVQVDVGQSPKMLAKINENWIAFGQVYNMALRALYVKKSILAILLGEARKYVDTATNEKREEASQHFKQINALVAACDKDIEKITGSGASIVSSGTGSIAGGKITSRQPDGGQFGVLYRDPITGNFR